MTKTFLSVAMLALVGHVAVDATRGSPTLLVRSTAKPRALPDLKSRAVSVYQQTAWTRTKQTTARIWSTFTNPKAFVPAAISAAAIYQAFGDNDKYYLYYLCPIGWYAIGSWISYITYDGPRAGAVTIDLVEQKLSYWQMFLEYFKLSKPMHVHLKSDVSNVEVNYTFTPIKHEGFEAVENANGTLTIGDRAQFGKQKYNISTKTERGGIFNDNYKKLEKITFTVSESGTNLFESNLLRSKLLLGNQFNINIKNADIGIPKAQGYKNFYLTSKGDNWHIMIDQSWVPDYKCIASIYPKKWWFSKGYKVQYNEHLCGKSFVPNNHANALVSLATMMVEYKLRNQ